MKSTRCIHGRLLLSFAKFASCAGLALLLIPVARGNDDLRGIVAMVDQGKLAEAERRLEAVLTSEPTSLPALRLMGTVARRLGKPQQATQALEKAHHLDPRNPAINTELILLYGDLKQQREAETLLQALLKSASYPDLMQAGAAFGESEAFTAARQAFERAAEMRPRSYDALFNLAFAMFREGNAGAALGVLNRIDHTEAEAHADYQQLRGRIELASGNLADAAQHLERALALDPGNESVCVELGLLYFRREAFSKAESVLDPCAARLPRSTPIRTALALNELELGRYEDSAESFRKVLALDPAADAAREALAFLLYASGKLPQARQVLEERLGGQHTDFFLYYLHALVLQRIDANANRAAICESLEQALRLNPRFAQGYLQRGRIRFGVGDTEGALQDFNMATQLDPNYAQPYFQLAQAYFKLGKKDEAKAAQQRFAALNKLQEEQEQKNQVENRVFQSLQ
ncbi:MAG: tetratricopeptide repeat protein [Terriglobia bacterium]